MNFCPYCGARLTEGPFCGSCGRRLPEIEGDARQPVIDADSSVTQRFAAADDTAAESAPVQETGAMAAQPPSRHPFGDIRAADYARDAVAVVLLIASLSMPWDATGAAADRLHVVLVTLLSLASLTLPYLRRAGVLPERWGNTEVRVARALANLPYLVVVVLTLVLDLAADGGVTGGVGVGVGFGLAGALLAAQARAADGGESPGHGQAWRLVTLGLVGLVAVLTLVRLVAVLTRLGDAGTEWGAATLALLGPLIFFVVMLIPVAAVLSRRGPARLVVLALGLAAAVMGLWRTAENSGLTDVLSLPDTGPAELFWMPLAAAVTAPGLGRLMAPLSPAMTWIRSATAALGVSAVIAGLSAVYWAVVVATFETGRGTSITILVLLLLATVAAVIGRSSVGSDPRSGRPVALTTAGVLILIAVVQLAVESAGVLGLFPVSALVVSALLVLPALVMVALSVPRVVRDELGPVELGGASFGGDRQG